MTGTIVDLDSIIAASRFIGPIEVLTTGSVASILCQEAVKLVHNKLQIDETLDVFAIHGVDGMFGAIIIAAFGKSTWASQLGSLLKWSSPNVFLRRSKASLLGR